MTETIELHVSQKLKTTTKRHRRSESTHVPTHVLFRVIHDAECGCSYETRVHWHNLAAYWKAHASEVEVYKAEFGDTKTGRSFTSWASGRFHPETLELTGIISLGGSWIFTIEREVVAGA